MRLSLRVVVLTLSFLALATSSAFASASNIYIAQNGAGAADGSSCANARAVAFFNTSGNWGAGTTQVGPGTTVHLCGTFVGSPSTTLLTFQGSGTAGNPVSVLFEPGAILTNTNWSQSGAIYSGGTRSYIVVDGGTANGNPQGIIRNTNNGSAGTYANQTDSGGVYFSSCSGCIIRNLQVQNLYVRNDVSDTVGGGDGVDISAGQGNRITNNWVNDSKICVGHGLNGTQNGIEIDHNKVWHCNWAFLSGTVVNIAVTNYSLHDNEAYDWSNWDDPATNSFHHNGLHMFMESGSGSQTVTNPLIYNNYFHGSVGNYMTAMIYLEANTGTVIGARVFNNIFSSDNIAYVPSNGFINAKGNNTSPVFYNNLFNYVQNVGGNCWLSQGASNADLRNNIFRNCGQVYYVPSGNIAIRDYNDFFGITTFDGSISALTAQRTSCSCESHSLSANPNLDSSYKPQAGSPLLGAGTDLSSLLMLPLDLDKIGLTRPAGSWDIGPFQVSSQSSAGSGPIPPALVSAVAQ